MSKLKNDDDLKNTKNLKAYLKEKNFKTKSYYAVESKKYFETRATKKSHLLSAVAYLGFSYFMINSTLPVSTLIAMSFVIRPAMNVFLANLRVESLLGTAFMNIGDPKRGVFDFNINPADIFYEFYHSTLNPFNYTLLATSCEVGFACAAYNYLPQLLNMAAETSLASYLPVPVNSFVLAAFTSALVLKATYNLYLSSSKDLPGGTVPDRLSRDELPYISKETEGKMEQSELDEFNKKLDKAKANNKLVDNVNEFVAERERNCTLVAMHPLLSAPTAIISNVGAKLANLTGLTSQVA